MVRRFMKLTTPFTVISNPFRDLDRFHDSNCKLPDEMKRDSWEEECKLHPAKGTCQLYEV